MNTFEEIKHNLADLIEGSEPINSLPAEYPAWTIRSPEGRYGAAVIYFGSEPIRENFHNCQIRTEYWFLSGRKEKCLVLSSTDEELRNEFAAVCAQFVYPGENGEERRRLLAEPIAWWKQWRDLMGNSVYEQEVYNVIAELMALEKQFIKNHNTEWQAIKGGSHDIESDDEAVEVKSTIKRYGSLITIAGQHQLESKKPLWIYFYRMEETNHSLSEDTASINDMVKRLMTIGYDRVKLEKGLKKLGFESGLSIRKKKYRVIEKKKYRVNDSFPKITDESFIGGVKPKGIEKIQYQVNLEILEPTLWE